MAKQSFATQLAKGFVRSAVNQVGRDGGRVLSNQIYGNRNYINVRGVDASPSANAYGGALDYTHIGENATLNPPISFGASKWFWFSVLSLFTYGLSNIGYAIYGKNLRKRTWIKIMETKTDVVKIPDRRYNLGYRTELKEYNVPKIIDAAQYVRNFYEKAGVIIFKASIIAFIGAIAFLASIFIFTGLKGLDFFAVMPLLYLGLLIGLPIWGHHAIKNAYAEELAKLEATQSKVDAQFQEPISDINPKTQCEPSPKKTHHPAVEPPEIPRYPEGFGNLTFPTYIAGANHYCTLDDIGGFAGYIIPEPTNPHDPNAMAIYAGNQLKHVGYIPAKKCAHYTDWCNNSPMICFGVIEPPSEGDQITGYIWAMRYVNAEQMQDTCRSFFDAIKEKGKAYLVPSEIHLRVNVEGEE